MGSRSLLIVFTILFTMLSRAVNAEGIIDPKEGWDELWSELMMDITLIGVLFGAITIYLLIKYKRRHPDDVGKGASLSSLAAFGWVVIPMFVFMADDIYLGAKNFELFNRLRSVPSNAYVVEVEAGMWSWEFKYPEGITTTNELRVAAGRPVHIKLTSRDVVHSFFIPDFRTKWDAVPGKKNYLWFYPKKAGEHVITCTEYCGTMHSSMYGRLIAMPEADFNKWIEENKPKGGTT